MKSLSFREGSRRPYRRADQSADALKGRCHSCRRVAVDLGWRTVARNRHMNKATTTLWFCSTSTATHRSRLTRPSSLATGGFPHRRSRLTGRYAAKAAGGDSRRHRRSGTYGRHEYRVGYRVRERSARTICGMSGYCKFAVTAPKEDLEGAA
jgi:hypothetical protein